MRRSMYCAPSRCYSSLRRTCPLPLFLFEYADFRGYYLFGFTVSGVASACLIAGALSRPVGEGWFGFVVFYTRRSLACAVALTGLVEAPALRLRDRLFP